MAKQTLTRKEIMEFFRSDEVAETLTIDDRMEIFVAMPVGADDLTADLFNELLSDYDTGKTAVLIDQDTVVFKWSVDDILGRMEDHNESITRAEAKSILANIDRQHDAEIGVNWNVIDSHISMFLMDKKNSSQSEAIYEVEIQYHDEDEPMLVMFSENCDEADDDDDIFWYGVSKSAARKMLQKNDVDFGDFKLISIPG